MGFPIPKNIIFDMAKSNLEKKVGLFVAIGLVLLAVLLLQFSKGTTFFRSTYQLRLKTSNVAGIKVRSSVLMSGVPVGTVSRIELLPNGKHVYDLSQDLQRFQGRIATRGL